MKTLTFGLTSPLQSFGNEASFSYRTTDDHPSKSSIIGMIGAALGYHRNDLRFRKLNSLSFAVRTDKPGKTLIDWHNVNWKKNKPPKVTRRYYLQDAVFVVAIGSDNHELIDKVKYALMHPIFQLYLGRRSNPPAGPLKIQEFDDIDPVMALNKLDWQVSESYQKRFDSEFFFADLFADAHLLKDGYLELIKDQVVSFDQKNRQFNYREVKYQSIKLKNIYFKDHHETHHDVIDFI